MKAEYLKDTQKERQKKRQNKSGTNEAKTLFQTLQEKTLN